MAIPILRHLPYGLKECPGKSTNKIGVLSQPLIAKRVFFSSPGECPN